MHHPAVVYSTRGYTWSGWGGKKVGFQGFLLYFFFSFLLEQLLQKQPRRSEKMASCVFKKQPLVDLEVKRGAAHRFFYLQEKGWLVPSHM